MQAQLIPEQKMLLITLVNGEDLIVERSGATLNLAFETSPADILVLIREGANAEMRVNQAVSIVTRSESIRCAYHHGVYAITKEAWHSLGTFRPAAAAELAFVEIFEANHRVRVCNQSIQGSLRELRQCVESLEPSGMHAPRDNLVTGAPRLKEHARIEAMNSLR